jgi:hypothetical protein
MTDEAIVLALGALDPALTTEDLEQMLELMIAIARADGRPFLAYLLGMALMEARNGDSAGIQAPH